MTRTRRRLLPLVCGVVLLAAGCSERQDIFSPEGPSAEKINRLQVPVFIIAGVVGVLVLGGILFLIVKGSRRHHDDDIDPVQLEGNFKLEIAWTIAPALLLAGVSVFTVATLLDLDNVGALPPELGEMEIDVYGHQWWWSYEYEMNPSDTSPENVPEVITANDLVIPAGVTIRLHIQSRDVIHSFWIPALAGTRDAVPGRDQELVIEADEPGVYDGQCKEFCGLSHAYMKQRVIALSLADFQTWMEQQQETQPMLAEGDPGYEGQQVFLAQCSSCHQINGLENADGEPIIVEGAAALQNHYAPNLTHLMTRGVFAGALFDLWTSDEEGRPIVNRSQLEAWVRDPASQKPMFDVVGEGELPRGMPDRGLTEDQIDQVVDYLLTLHPAETDGPPIQTAGAQD